jgi:hypothetical protein
MSSEFYFRKVAPFVIQAIETHGALAFDAFWKGDWVDDFENEEEIQNIFRVIGQVEKLNQQRDIFLSLLQEGKRVNELLQDCHSENGWEIFEYNFLIAGRHQHCYEADFLIREVELNPLNPTSEKLLLVNALVGHRKIRSVSGEDSGYFSPSDVCEIVRCLPKILDDDLALRWHRLQMLYPDEYLPQRTLKDAFSGDSEWPRRFLQETWLPFLQDAVKRGCGILTVCGY